MWGCMDSPAEADQNSTYQKKIYPGKGLKAELMYDDVFMKFWYLWFRAFLFV